MQTMKAPLKTRDRPTAEEAIRIARAVSPTLPPARLPVEDKAVPFNMRLRLSTVAEIEARARQEGVSLKLMVCRALAAYGLQVASADLEDGTPRRRMAA
jgi:hypothetical protein